MLPRWQTGAVLLVLLGATLWYSIPAWRSQHALAAASTALEDGDTATFDRLAQQAADVARTDTTALNALAMQRGERALRSTDPAEQRALARQAVDLFSSSLARNPDQEICLTNLAWLRLRTEPRLASAYFLAAARQVPDKDGLYLGLAYAFLAEGRSLPAVNALALECLAHPSFLVSPQWRDSALAPLREAVLERVARRATALAAEFPAGHWNHTELAYLAGLARWIGHSASAAEVAALAPTDDRKRFFADWEKPDRKLLPESRDALRRHFIALHLAPPDDAWLEATQQFAALSAAQQRERLFDPASLPAGLVALTRAQRVGYGVLVKNLDTPVPVDFYYAQHHRLMEDFFDFLFPSQLRLPGPVLQAELEAALH
jgi:hypothetical protein